MDLTEVDATIELHDWLATGRAREIRENANLSQDMAARALGVTSRALWNWENRRTVPRTVHARHYHALLTRLAAQFDN